MSVHFFYDESDDVRFSYLAPTQSYGRLPPPYQKSTTPRDYLEWALDDISEGDERGRVNAFSNAKRSLHFAVDTLLQQYGLFDYFGDRDFADRLDALADVGLLPTTILENINLERNAIEHDYEIPSQARVEEAVDIAKLLLLAVDRLVQGTVVEAVVGWGRYSDHSLMQLHPYKGKVTYTDVDPGDNTEFAYGVEYCAGPFRNILTGEIEGVEVRDEPSTVIQLNAEERHSWESLVKELVAIHRKRSVSESIQPGEGEVMIPVTLPAPDQVARSFTERIPEELGKQTKEALDDNEAKDSAEQ